LIVLRAKELGFTMADLDTIEIGFLIDVITEKTLDNNAEDYEQYEKSENIKKGDQIDFNNF
jgi:hypothetical protein